MCADSVVAVPVPEPQGAGVQDLEVLRRFAAMADASPMVAMHSTDSDGIVRYWNAACATLFGVAAADAIGRPFKQLVSHLDDQADFDATIASVWRSGCTVPGRDWQIGRPDGARRWVYSSHFPLLHDGAPQQVIGTEIDITARKAAERALYLAAQVFENCRSAVLIMDRRWRVVALNPAFSRSTGLAAGQVVGVLLSRLLSGAHRPTFQRRIGGRVLAHGHWEGELWALRASGDAFPVWAALTAVRDAAGRIDHFMAVIADITERKRREERTRHLAEHDFLTDLPNRVLFIDRLHQALASARRQHTQLALMFVDLDHFKAINDQHGHQLGDEVLKEVARRLSGCVRGVDTVSRQGGDEFLVLLADIGGVDQAAHVAASAMHALSQPLRADGRTFTLSASIGIGIHPTDGDDADTLLKHADLAMYHAKQNGRNAFSFFNPAMNAHVIERGQMAERLRRALENAEFVLEYQPEIDIASGRTTGVEALIRWRHPERGLLLPGQFIPAAEDCGLMVPIGEWVLRQACRQACLWRDCGFPVVVAVNLSNVQFTHNNLVHSIEQALERAGLQPQFLNLEITEGVIMSGDQAVIATIEALRARGMRLTIDDFGTGYSSLSHLRRFPLSKLKIDRSFVGDIAREVDGQGIIPAIIAVARSLKLRVLAEGVETAEQLQYLRLHGCDEYQGHYASAASADPDLTGVSA